MSRTKKSNEKIRAPLRKSAIDCMNCPKCNSSNYRRTKGDYINFGGSIESQKEFQNVKYCIYKYCDNCKESHRYEGKLAIDFADFEIIKGVE